MMNIMIYYLIIIGYGTVIIFWKKDRNDYVFKLALVAIPLLFVSLIIVDLFVSITIMKDVLLIIYAILYTFVIFRKRKKIEKEMSI